MNLPAFIPPWLAKYVDLVITMALQYTPKFVLALLTLWIGFWITRIIVRGMTKTLQMRHVNRSLSGFLESVVSVGLKVMVLVTVATMLGVQTTSFIAVLGAAGLAIGLSLQGSLANLAGGILILLFKPFEVGEEVEIMGKRGIVQAIEMFTTVMRADDQTLIFLPNGPVSNGVIVNFSRHAPKA